MWKGKAITTFGHVRDIPMITIIAAASAPTLAISLADHVLTKLTLWFLLKQTRYFERSILIWSHNTSSNEVQIFYVLDNTVHVFRQW